jgi:hypothetical protein
MRVVVRVRACPFHACVQYEFSDMYLMSSACLIAANDTESTRVLGRAQRRMNL